MKQYIQKLKILLQFNIFLILLLIFTFVYVFNYQYGSKINYKDGYSELILTVKDYSINDGKVKIIFNEEIIGSYIIDKIDFSLNDVLYVKGNIHSPTNNTIPNTFNYKKYLNNNRINKVINIDEIVILKGNTNIFYKIKNNIYKKVKLINNKYIYAFLLGKTNYLYGETYDNYKINGVTHLFAISGMHISLLSSVLLLILNKLKININISYIFIIFFLFFFSFIASFSPSVLRALILYILTFLNRKYNLNISTNKLLIFDMIILLVINPLFIYNDAFILSFIVSFFIILFSSLNKTNIINISLISFFSSFPIIINMNYELNIVNFVSNILFIPFISYIVFPFSLIVFIFPIFNNAFIYLCSIMEMVSSFSANLINITLCFRRINLYELIIYYFLLYILIRYKNKVLYIFCFAFLIYLYLYNRNNLSIYYLDVGQGDSILLHSKENILIDTGGSIKNNYAVNNTIVFFKSIGIKNIDYLIISHGDYDHMGEAINLVENFKVENVIFNCGSYNDLESELIEVLEKKNIKYYSCIKELNIDKYKLQFLNTGTYDNENDNSSVIYFNYKTLKFLFMGDASVEREKDILEKYNLSNIDFLKVGHHGSNTSSSEDFIYSINPNYSLISVGKNNRYGHPKDEVLEILKNSKIYRTDLDGSIEIKLNKNGYKIRTCPP